MTDVTRLGEALYSPRYLRTRWPWIAAAHLASSLPLLLLVGAALAVVWLPWIGMVGRLPDHGVDGVALVLVGVGVVTSLVCLPPLATAVAHLERVRARIIDREPIVAPAAEPGLKAIYLSPTSARAVAYLLVLLVGGFTATAAVLIFGVAAGIALAAPLIVGGGDGPIALGPWQISSPEAALVLPPLGLALLAGLAYLVGFTALGEVISARTLLGTTPEEVGRELTEVVRSRGRLIDAFDAERRRIERDLHDGAQQRLVALTLRLGLARAAARPGSLGYDDLTEAHDMAKELMRELREFIHDIHPQALTDHGLPEALRELADRSVLPVVLRIEPTRRLARQLEATIYFSIAEAHSNAVRHSGAARIEIEVTERSGRLFVRVVDDGRGGADPSGGTGIVGIADRLAGVDGRLTLSSPAGGPTVLTMELPCP